MKTLIIINDAPYGSERPYNAMRLALQLGKDYPEMELTVFLMADAVSCAISGQKTPNGYYNMERMLDLLHTHGGRLLLCGSCMDARGITSLSLVEGAVQSTMAELAGLTVTSDKVLNF